MFASQELVTSLNTLVDSAEDELDLNSDQSTVFAVIHSVRIFLMAVGDRSVQRGDLNDPYELPAGVMHSLIDILLWANDRLELSLLTNES